MWGKTYGIRPLSAVPRIRSRIKETALRQSSQTDQARSAVPWRRHGVVGSLRARGRLGAARLQAPFACCAWVLLIYEVAPVLVTNDRRLLQGKAVWTIISSAQLICMPADYILGGVRIGGIANDWRERATMLAEPGQLWLAENSIVVDVRAPLWNHVAAISRQGGGSSILR